MHSSGNLKLFFGNFFKSLYLLNVFILQIINLSLFFNKKNCFLFLNNTIKKARRNRIK